MVQPADQERTPFLRLHLVVLVVFAAALQQAASAQRLLLVAQPQGPVEARYVAFLQQGLQAQGAAVSISASNPGEGGKKDTVVLGAVDQMATLLTPAQFQQWQHAPKPHGPEAYSVVPIVHQHRTTLVLAAAEHGRGELFAVGWLLRSTQTMVGTLMLPHGPAFSTSPERPVRGYQVGYRMKNNTYDAWTVPQFQQQMLDLAVFGMNTMQVVAPLSDDAASSPLFPAPAETTVVNLSRISQDYGLRFDLYYPEMAKDYANPAQVAAELKQFESLVKELPLVDSLHIPGGDPGHTPPDLLFPLVEQEAVILHHYHPHATVWLSAQGFNAEAYQRFYALMAGRPTYLDGIFFGPQSRESMEEQRARIPPSYPLEFYPDTAHTMHAQFPVPDWDPVFALTEGREPIDPRPMQFAHIYRQFFPFNSGSIVYSEGVNDDVNKALWGAWGWNAGKPANEILRGYARYFFHANGAEQHQIATAIEDLESNWEGPLLRNTQIASTLAVFDQLRPKNAVANWRWDSLVYRATYDRYVQLKRKRELATEQDALRTLADSNTSAANRIAAARAILPGEQPSAEEQRLHSKLEQLAGALFREGGLQLSVKRYGASNWERGANLDRIDTPLNDRVWIEHQLREAAALHGAPQAERLAQIARWRTPAAGGFYDDLGDPSNEPHLLKGAGWSQDPELYHTAVNGIADKTLEDGWRFSWLDYAETLYEQPLQMRYTGLKPGIAYTLRVTYAGEDYVLPMRLTANGVELQPFRQRATNPEQREYVVSADLVQAGTLQIAWTRAFGAGGGGRGGQVAEVWLLPR